MSPVDAIQQLVSILANTTPPFSEQDVYIALEEAGVPDDIADRAYKFGQIACGRKLLDSMGISFSNKYICFNADGSVIESGNLSDEPFFIEASQHAGPESIGGPAFGHFALMSADVNAINDALNSGSSASDLVTGPAFLFLEQLTESGMANARRVMDRHLQSLKTANPRSKAWWKFW